MKKRISMALAIPLALVALVAVAPIRGADLSPEGREKLRALYSEAIAAAQAKDFAKANDRLSDVLKLLPPPKDGSLDPNLARVHYEMASNHARLGLKKDALESLSRAVDAGYWDHKFLAADPSLVDLRPDKGFTEILERARRGVPGMAFGLKDVNGREIRKEDYQGKVLVIDVFGTWCPPCRKEIPHFVRLQSARGKDGVAVIGLAWERVSPEQAPRVVGQFVDDNRINYQVALLPPPVYLSIAPRVQSYPTTIYVGRDGLVADRVIGYEDYDRIEARALKLLREKPAPEAPGKPEDRKDSKDR